MSRPLIADPPRFPENWTSKIGPRSFFNEDSHLELLDWGRCFASPPQATRRGFVLVEVPESFHSLNGLWREGLVFESLAEPGIQELEIEPFEEIRLKPSCLLRFLLA